MKKQNKPFVFIIFGPTAVGKTDFALELAKHIPAEIINGDSGQFYTPLSIGTAKPDWKNEPVPHHLFDIVDEPKDFSVVAYRKKVIETVQDIFSRGKLPIIVGGSGFYLKSLFFVPAEQEKKAQEDRDDMLHGRDISWEKLFEVDPIRAQQIEKNDLYRVKRALAIWYSTGKKPSEFVPTFDPPFNFLLCYLTRDRKQLYERINMRTGSMIENGWLAETKALLGAQWEAFLYRKKLIGYDVLFDYLHEKITLEQAIEIIQKQTRKYAKRQETFWRMLERQIQQASEKFSDDITAQTQLINLTLSGRDLYIKQLLKRLRSHIK